MHWPLQDQIRLLKQEKVKMEDRRQASVRLFRDWRTHLLADIDHGKTVDAFLAHCILPRCILTTEDATYCAAFIRKLVLEDTPYFSFMFLMQQVCVLLLPCLAADSTNSSRALSAMCLRAKRFFAPYTLTLCTFGLSLHRQGRHDQ